jgi:branched-chain amino acid transport system permease protein
MTGSSWRAISLAVAALAALPLLTKSNVTLNSLSFAGIVALAAQGWNLLAGYGGQFSFGHAAFFGTGAYTMALLQVRFGVNPWAALPLAILAGAVAGTFIGFVSFRAGLRGSYFALITLAFAEVFRILVNSWSFAGGAAGVLVPLNIGTASMQFEDRRALYWLILAFVAGGLVLTNALARTRLGAQLIAVRENENAALALGVDTFAVKLQAIALSGMLTAAAGGLYVQKYLYLDASLGFGTWISIEALLAPIAGGLGTVLGPLAGTAALLGIGEITKESLARLTGTALPGIDLIAYGLLLIAVIGFAPRGLIGVIEHVARRALQRGAA